MKADNSQDLLKLSVILACLGWGAVCWIKGDPVAFWYGVAVAAIVFLLSKPYANR